MPTERFYRLPEEKKRTIRDAAFKEFARVPIDKVSINQIIKEADISRGSFYTYFEDKWDVLSYIFEESKDRVWTYCFSSLSDSGGDIWFMLEMLLEKILEFCSGEEKYKFIKHVMSHAGSEEFIKGFSGKSSERECAIEEEQIRWIYDHYDKSQMKPLTYDEFTHFIQLSLLAIGLEVKGFFEGAPAEKALSEFQIKLNILRFGVCPQRAGDCALNGAIEERR